MPAAKPLQVHALFRQLFNLGLIESVETALLETITKIAMAADLPDIELAYRSALEQLARLSASKSIDALQVHALSGIMKRAAMRET